jgi:hypothetical protein
MNEIDATRPEGLDDGATIYYFASGWNANSKPLVELTKSWPKGQESLVVGYYEGLQEMLDTEMALVEMRSERGLDATMREVERMAVEAGTLDPARADGRLFTDGPPDPFTTQRERELAGLGYSYDVIPQPQGLYELEATKTWTVDGVQGNESLPLGDYDRLSDATQERDMLRELGARQGQEAEMQAVERLALENGSLDSQRADPRLFQEGPPDPFTTLREQELERTDGYFFRAGPTLDPDAAGEGMSLDLIQVERKGAEYAVTQTEFMRVEQPDAEYVFDAAGKFNRMLEAEGTGPSVAAAATWAREHGAEPDFNWQPLDMGRFDRGSLEFVPKNIGEMDTEPLLPETRERIYIDF